MEAWKEATMGGEGPSINPKELVGQSGPDEGRIIDVELAHVGAKAENGYRDSGKGSGVGKDSFEDPDAAGEMAMADEVAVRAMENTGGMEILFPEDVDKVALQAMRRFKKEMWERSPEGRRQRADNTGGGN